MMEHRRLTRVSFTDLKNYIGCNGIIVQRVSPLGRKGLYAIYSGIIEEAPFIATGHDIGYALAYPKDGRIHQVISPTDRIFVEHTA